MKLGFMKWVGLLVLWAGASLALDLDTTGGPVDPNNPAFYECALRSTSNGTGLTELGCTVTQVATGRYQITFTNAQANANYPIFISPEGLAARDDYFLDYFNVTTTGFLVRGTEQDNGGAAGVYRNMGFSVFVPKM